MAKKAYDYVYRDERGEGVQAPDLYRILDTLISRHHKHLAEAKFLFAWHYGWKADADGNLRKAQLKKATESSLHGYDFIIHVNHEYWNSSTECNDNERWAIIDSRLAFIRTSTDDDGEVKTTDAGKAIFRICQPDYAGHFGPLHRYGTYDQPHKWLDKILSGAKPPNINEVTGNPEPILQPEAVPSTATEQVTEPAAVTEGATQ